MENETKKKDKNEKLYPPERMKLKITLSSEDAGKTWGIEDVFYCSSYDKDYCERFGKPGFVNSGFLEGRFFSLSEKEK